MANSEFKDPLEGIDPIMEQVFSSSDVEDDFFLNSPEKNKIKNEGSFFDTPKEKAGNQEEQHSISELAFPKLKAISTGAPMPESVFSNIPVNVSVELGRAKVSLKEVFELTEGAIIELERLVGEPLDLVVNGQIVARGEVVAVDNNYGFRVTTVSAVPAQVR